MPFFITVSENASSGAPLHWGSLYCSGGWVCCSVGLVGLSPEGVEEGVVLASTPLSSTASSGGSTCAELMESLGGTDAVVVVATATGASLGEPCVSLS